MMMKEYDLVVIGAGPAGIRAALEANRYGLRTLIIDEQAAPGGQIYRNTLHADQHVRRMLGPDYQDGLQLAQKLMASPIHRAFNTTVWDISPDLVVTMLSDGTTRSIQGKQIIAATGAIERASPLIGWTLPGVLTAGAAQIALKADASIPSGPVVLVGCGPLLLLVARQLLDAGAQVAAVIETSPRSNRGLATRHLPSALRAPGYLAKGVALMASLVLHRVPWFRCARNVEVLGHDRAKAVRFSDGEVIREIAADTVLLHHGVVPNHQISQLMRVEHRWVDIQRAWRVVCDDYGQTSVAGFRIAGDGVAIAGAKAAEKSGALAALGAANALGVLTKSQLHDHALPWKKALQIQLAIRPFLDSLYRPPDWICAPADNTTVCRCEHVTAGEIRQMADIGCIGPNQTKFFSRCGMGPCQGRVCGGVVTQILSERLCRTVDEIGSYRVRSPIKPVTLQAIANYSDSD
nr:NAD(P)/FAD-dependent oxidoreductase [Advenella incenata]